MPNDKLAPTPLRRVIAQAGKFWIRHCRYSTCLLCDDENSWTIFVIFDNGRSGDF